MSMITSQDFYNEAENHESRSRNVFSLLYKTRNTETRGRNLSGRSIIPKTILQFWHDRKGIPEDVKVCLESWNVLEASGFQVLLFDRYEANTFIQKYFPSEYVTAFENCDHPAMECDFFRLCYLYQKGGFYVDADEEYTGEDCSDLFEDNKIKLQPLCYDLRKESMVSPSSFLNLTQYESGMIFYVNNNPIVSPRGHPLLLMAIKRAVGLLCNSQENKDLGIQEIAGPGNLSASLVRHSLSLSSNGKASDFSFIRNWDKYSSCNWFLSYRNDSRNWRLYKRGQ